ncbi:hypothetical protein ACWDO0_17305 [Nocardia rhamnosiphila]
MALKGVRIHRRHRRDVGAFTWVMGPHQAESAGTADTIRLAREAGIQVCEYTDPRITQRHLHPDIKALIEDGKLLSEHLRSPSGPHLRVVGE